MGLLLKDLLMLLAKIAFIILVFLILSALVFGIIRYEEHTMSPAIQDGDLVVFYRLNQNEYQPRDAIVLKYGGQTQIRRVVATEGDQVDITDSGLIINGALQQEPDIYEKTERYRDGGEFPLTVPEGHVFVLGDSRTNATDSRIYGCVETEETLGKVMTVIRRRGI